MAMKPQHKEIFQKFTESHNGKPLDQKALLKSNPVIQKTLVARFMSMTPEQQDAIKGILTPQTVDSLKVLLPEIAGLIDRGMNLIKRGMRNG